MLVESIGKSMQHVVAHGLLLLFTLLLVLKLDRLSDFSWWAVFSPLWLFHASISRGRFSLPAPSIPHDRRWAPFHAIVATPLLVAFELLLCIHLQSFDMSLKIVFVPLLAFEISIFVDNIRMCRSLMPGDEDTISDEAIWETLPHFWVAMSMVFFTAATTFTLLKLCGDISSFGWRDLFVNFGIAQCFAFIVCTKWYNPAIHSHMRPCIIGSSSSSTVNAYHDWHPGIVVSPEEDQEQSRMCNLQEIGGHIMKVPIIGFQVLLIMHLEATPSTSSQLSFRVIFTPLLLLQGACFSFATFRLVEKAIILANRDAASGRYLIFSSKIHEFFGFLHHGSRLLGWWSIDEGSQEEHARLYHAATSSYNTFSPDIVKKLAKSDLVKEIWRLQEALSVQSEITKISQEDYENFQNDKILCKVCFEEHINIVLLPCRHHVICSTCGEKCKRCPICRSSIEILMPVNEV